jgi:hypothetical protein
VDREQQESGVAVEQRIDWMTIAGWGALLMPLLTMWHEVGGHAAACAIQGGHVATIGAFYVDCTGLTGVPDVIVACAGVAVNAVLSLVTFRLWRGADTDSTRLVLWLVWVSEAFVAAGYFCFSGFTGVGDLGTGADGSLASLPWPPAWRWGEAISGIIAYGLIIRAGITGLNDMLGTGAMTRLPRRQIAHVYYATAGFGAVLVGLLNPVGLFITIMSAAASSFGGLAGFISIGYAARGPDGARDFVIRRNWPVIAGGALTLLAFAAVLGPSIRR